MSQYCFLFISLCNIYTFHNIQEKKDNKHRDAFESKMACLGLVWTATVQHSSVSAVWQKMGQTWVKTGSLSCVRHGVCVEAVLTTTASHRGNSHAPKEECLWVMICLSCIKTKVYISRPFADCLHMNKVIFGHDRCITVLWGLYGSIISTHWLTYSNWQLALREERRVK